MTDTRWTLAVLGPVLVGDEEGAIDLRPRERDVLAALAVTQSATTRTVELVEVLWPDEVPPSAPVTVQNHVARIRRRLGADAIATEGGGYRLGVGWSLDVDQLAELVRVATRWRRVGRPELAVDALDDALSLVRGRAFDDLPDVEPIVGVRRRLAEVVRTAGDDLLLALLASGATGRVTIEGPDLCEAEPFREVRWSAVALGLYRDGQRREALRVLRRGDETLRERSGLDPGPTLRRLESQVLDDDPLLMSADVHQLLDRAGERWIDRGGGTTARRVTTAIGTERELTAAARVAFDDLRFSEAALLVGAAAAESERERGSDAEQTLDLRLQQAEALRLAGDPSYPDLVRTLVEPAERAGGDLLARVATALCRLGPLSAAGHLDEHTAALVERAVVGCDDVGVRARCRTQAALFYSMTGHVDRASEHFEGSLVDARASGDPATLLDALSGAYAIVTHPADQQRRREIAAEMLNLAELLHDDEGRFGALHLYFATQVVDADPLLRTTFRHQELLAQRLHSAGRRWMAAYQRAALAHLDGRLDDALAITEDAYETAPVSESRAASTRWMMLVLVRSAQGRVHELADDVDRALEAQPGLPGWRAVAAWLAAQVGDRDRVVAECRMLDDGLAIPPDMTWGAAATLLTRAAAAVGHTDGFPTLQAMLAPYSGSFTWYGSGSVGPFDLALAEVALARGDRDGARHHLAIADALVSRLNAVVFQPDLDRVRAAVT